LEISTDEIVEGLAGQKVTFVKRFRFKCKESSEIRDSKSVFLQFSTAGLPQTFLSAEHCKVILSGQGTSPDLPSKHKRFFTQIAVIKVSYCKQNYAQ